MAELGFHRLWPATVDSLGLLGLPLVDCSFSLLATMVQNEKGEVSPISSFLASVPTPQDFKLLPPLQLSVCLPWLRDLKVIGGQQGESRAQDPEI